MNGYRSGGERFPKIEPDCRAGAIQKAVEVLKVGGLVAFPTESFYGLAVDPADPAAVRRLFGVKEREAQQPILLLLPDVDALGRYAARVPEKAHNLIRKFWPGGLTLVFEAASHVSDLLTTGTGKIGLRLSSHPMATGLAQAFGKAITGTSANISGRPACRDAQEVWNVFGERIDLILDGGQTPGGLGSTILDMTVDPPLILREGRVARSEIEKVIRFLCPSIKA